MCTNKECAPTRSVCTHVCTYFSKWEDLLSLHLHHIPIVRTLTEYMLPVCHGNMSYFTYVRTCTQKLMLEMCMYVYPACSRHTYACRGELIKCCRVDKNMANQVIWQWTVASDVYQGTCTEKAQATYHLHDHWSVHQHLTMKQS